MVACTVNMKSSNHPGVWMAAAIFFIVLIIQPVDAKAKTLSNQELATQECGACHYAYPPRYLPAYSWKKILDNLDNHFGEDASLDDASRNHILAYMVGTRSMDIPIRITKTSWWTRIHGNRIQTYAREKSVKLSNCGKCHR